MGRKSFVEEISKEELIEDAKRIYEKERKKNPKFELFRDDYSKYSKYKRSQLSKHFGSWKSFIELIESYFKPNREDIINNAKEIFLEEKEKNKNFVLKRDFFVKKGNYTKIQIETEFGTFTDFLDIVKKELGIVEEEVITRDSFDNIKKDERKKLGNRKYVVTSLVAGTQIDDRFLNSIKNYCKHNKAELVVLAMRGISVDDIFYPEILSKVEDNICSEMVFNSNLKAVDFKLSPAMINPLTGLGRMGAKRTSLIIASPKQQMQSVPVSNRTLPHVLYSTGTISIPEYSNNRIGVLGEEDNVVGGLIVEIENNEIFHIRLIVSDNKGCFYDLDKYYSPDEIKKSSIEAIVLGDLHSGSEDAMAVQSWKEIIHLTNPKYIVFHDIMDSMSINHHQEKNIVYNANLPVHAKTLEKELDTLGNTLKQWSEEFKKSTLIITKGNHDAWLDKYLQEGKYARPEQAHNHRFALSLANYVLDDKNPIEEYINKKYKIKNIKWLRIDEDFIIKRNQLGYHGAKGSNSGRNSAAALELARGAGIYGHSHSPAILRNTMIVGTTTKLKLDYNMDGASSWLHASGLLYSSEYKTLIISIEGKWKI
jgi:hypothetical protein